MGLPFEMGFFLSAHPDINFGLVLPGIWVGLFGKTRNILPEEMAFSVNYLGANITQVGLNFSRPAAQILGQYYQFIRSRIRGLQTNPI